MPEGDHARRIVEAHANQLGEGPEINVLRWLGLFHKEPNPAEVEVLRTEPLIEGLTDKILPLTRGEWNSTLAKLRSLELLTPAREDEPRVLDAHPLVRAYFKHQVREKLPTAWFEGHHRLFEYYLRLAPEKPAKKEEMEALFEALFHGCSAGEYARAFREVLLPRMPAVERETALSFCQHEHAWNVESDIGGHRTVLQRSWIGVRDGFSDRDKAFLFDLGRRMSSRVVPFSRSGRSDQPRIRGSTGERGVERSRVRWRKMPTRPTSRQGR